MGNPVLEKVIGPKISEAVVEALGEDRPDDTVVEAKVKDQIREVVDLLDGRSVATWYNFFGDWDGCVRLPDGTRYSIVDVVYPGEGTFEVQLRKRQH